MECEHSEGSPVGKCAICDRMVCSECYRTVFTETICDAHDTLEEESEWELIGFYGDTAAAHTRRYVLEEQGITSLAVEAEEDSIELYVPVDDREDAYEVLITILEDAVSCGDCKIQYANTLEACPLCGVKAPDRDSETVN